MARAKPRKPATSKRTKRPSDAGASVEDLCRQAAAVLAGNHQRRLSIARDRGLAKLARRVNGIIEILASKEHSLGENIQSLQKVNRELRETQDSLLRSEKLAAIGRVSAGIAHEIGNPIGAILGYLDLLKRRGDIDEDIRDSLSRAESEAWRINAIIGEMLDFARPSSGLLEPLDVNEVIHATLDALAQQGTFDGLAFKRDLVPTPPPVAANGHRLRQLLVNLLTNAADASDGHGTIVVGTRVIESAEETPLRPALPPRRKTDPPEMDYSHLRPFLDYDPTADRPLCAEARWVEIRVSDSGRGIPAETLREVFDPFFTTKPAGKGTGLGLPLSLSIVLGFRGRLQISSELGSGTTVTVQIPVEKSADDSV